MLMKACLKSTSLPYAVFSDKSTDIQWLRSICVNQTVRGNEL